VARRSSNAHLTIADFPGQGFSSAFRKQVVVFPGSRESRSSLRIES
jgi:hypothetical protein